MFRAFHSECIKLFRPGVLLAAGLIAVFGLFVVVLTLLTAGSQSQHIPGGASSLTTSQISAADGFARVFGRGSTFMGVIALGIAAMNVASEYSQGTLRELLIYQPRRTELLAGKLIALGILIVAAVAVAYAAALLVAIALAPSQGVSTTEWFSSSGWTEILSGYGDAVLAALGWGVMGVVLGVFLRSPAPALGAGVAWALPFEAFLSSAWETGKEWLPGQALQALASGGTDSIAYGRAAMLVGVYVLVALALAVGSFRTRDVTV